MTDRPATEAETAKPPLQRVAGLVALPALLARHGIDVDECLASAGLPSGALNDSQQTFPYSALPKLLAEAIERTGCPHLGLEIGAGWWAADSGLVAEMARTSATLGEAIETFVAYQWINSDGGVIFRLQYPESVMVGYVVARPLNGALSVIHDVAASSITGAMRVLLGDDWNPTSVRVPHAPPADRAPYRNFFRCPVHFNSEHAAVVLPTSELARPLPGADAARKRALEAEAARQPDPDLVTKLYRSLRVLLLDGAVHAERVAQHLSLSRRTLDRRLSATGTTFKAVLDEVRLEVARHLLRDTTLSASRIAEALGYNDETAFIRAFRGWTGMPPGRWRAEAAALPAPASDTHQPHVER